MPELIFSFDAPLEANHISSEDTQAQLDEFRQMSWIKLEFSPLFSIKGEYIGRALLSQDDLLSTLDWCAVQPF